MYEQKLTKIGNSIGIVLPRKLLNNLGLDLGSKVYIEQLQNKAILETEPSESVSPDFLKIAEKIGKKYAAAFKELA